jgi:predicted Rossmann fold nucleotide-binding protein DprA/Smf involved in DNA uptake
VTDSIERATAYLLKLEADRTAAIAASEENMREAMLIKAREEGFREAMEIFGLTLTPTPEKADVERGEVRRKKRRNIREMIIKELAFSSIPKTKHQIAQAIDYLPRETEAVLKRLEIEGIVQNRDGHWEAVGAPVVQSNGHAKAA